MLKRYWVEILLTISVGICGWSIFSYYNTFSSNGISTKTTNWGEFGDYLGGVLGTIFSFLSVVLIYITYKSQSKGFQLQQFETTFFNLLQVYRLSVERLHERRLHDLSNEYDRLIGASYYSPSNLESKDFFDALYFVLDKRYKKVLEESHESGVYEGIDSFFKDYYYMIGHYIRNFISIIEFVDKHKIENKEFYISILRDAATIDELRLIFYATIWKKSEDGKRWKNMQETYKIFDFIGNDKNDKKLINTKDDLKAYYEI
ncbi:MAG: putative phage abortive infection protein [Chitinophagaceae bacterium]|nr:putative phage abortive infection protein [Chitinophagaceae bacterium]